MSIHRRSILLAAAMFAANLSISAPCLAAAEGTQLSVSANTMGFSSVGDAYGPWSWGTLSLRQGDMDSAYQVSLSTRTDRDKLVSTHGNFGEVLYYKSWSRNVYSNISVGIGSGDVYARNLVSADVGFRGRNSAVIVGASRVNYQSGTASTMFRTGPVFYSPLLNVSFLATENINTGSPGGLGGIVDLQAVSKGKETANLAISYQHGQYETLVPNIPPAQANVDSYEARLSKTFQLGVTNAAFKVEISALKLDDRISGKPLFFGRGLGLTYTQGF